MFTWISGLWNQNLSQIITLLTPFFQGDFLQISNELVTSCEYVKITQKIVQSLVIHELVPLQEPAVIDVLRKMIGYVEVLRKHPSNYILSGDLLTKLVCLDIIIIINILRSSIGSSWTPRRLYREYTSWYCLFLHSLSFYLILPNTHHHHLFQSNRNC